MYYTQLQFYLLYTAVPRLCAGRNCASLDPARTVFQLRTPLLVPC